MKTPRRTRANLIIGWREWVALPDLGVQQIKAKVDTGARTSALHAFDIRRVRRGDKRYIRFKVHPEQRDNSIELEARAPLIDERLVRNSGGTEQLRPVISTTLEIMGMSWEIEMTLTTRDVMGFRMLLGREAVRGHALVDPGGSYHCGRRSRRS